jgi:FAD/FMN-containing dehydrogenase
VELPPPRLAAARRLRRSGHPPDDPGYDQVRSVFYGAIDHRPAVIVRPTGATEVAQVITLARESGLELAVRCGGHSLAGHGTCEGNHTEGARDARVS